VTASFSKKKRDNLKSPKTNLKGTSTLKTNSPEHHMGGRGPEAHE